MSTIYSGALDEANAARQAYIAALEDQERTSFLLQLLSDSSSIEQTNGLEKVDLAWPTSGGGGRDEFSPDEQYVGSKAAASFASQVRIAGANHVNNPRWRSRCGCDAVGTCSTSSHGTSYVAVDYNYGVGRGAFDIVVYIRHYGRDYFEGSTWDDFVNCHVAYRLWQSGRLHGPGSPGRAGYFQTGNNQTAGPHHGTLGVAAYSPGTTRIEWWGRWYFDKSTWGDEWLHCGKDYNVWLEDV